MGSRNNADKLSQQLDDLRDQAADLLASEGSSRGGSSWPGRLLLVGLGVGIGAAAAGGRLLKLLPAQLASRLEGVAGQAASAASELTEKVTTAVGATGEQAGETVGEVTDATDQLTGEMTEGTGLG
jgi:hypothetical protein